MPDEWKFSDDFDPSRRTRLEAYDSYAQICELIKSEMGSISVDIEPAAAPGLEGCVRPVYTFRVPNDTYDAFFNSPMGYRAQYLADPAIGDFANRVLIDGISRNLLAVGPSPMCHFDMPLSAIEDSIQGSSAKIWIHEDSFPFGAVTRDLDIETWVAIADAYGTERAVWGLCAPTGDLLQVKGAFIDEFGNERVPASKVGRCYGLHNSGFT